MTGGNREFGQGLELASRGARVFMGARDSGAAQGVIDDDSSRLSSFGANPCLLDLICFANQFVPFATGTIVNVSSLAHLSVPRVDTEDPMARNRPFD